MSKKRYKNKGLFDVFRKSRYVTFRLKPRKVRHCGTKIWFRIDIDDYFPFLKTDMKNGNLLPKEPCSFVFDRGVFIMMAVGLVQ